MLVENEYIIRWYKHEPKDVTNGNNVIILWNFPSQTDRGKDANKPDIVVKDLKEGTCLLIDITCHQDSHVSGRNSRS